MKGFSKFFFSLLAIIVVIVGTVQIRQRLQLESLPAYVLSINGTAFLFFTLDKLLAPLKFLNTRVPERVLIWGLVFPGGIIGAVAAMLIWGHKVSQSERPFRMELLLAVVGTVIAVALISVLSGLWPAA